MLSTNLSTGIAESFVRAGQHAMSQHPWERTGGERKPAPAFTIALSREAGTRGTSVARAVGQRVGWPVYDNELVERIARDTNVRAELLRHVDERPNSWLQECIEGFSHAATLGEEGYVRRLRLILWSLGASGACVIVGRGAAHFLPKESTLRVRLLAERSDRIQSLATDLRVSSEEATRQMETLDRNRLHFIRGHFGKDPTDPQNYDLILNVSRFAIDECADLIVQTLRTLEARAMPTRKDVLRGSPVPHSVK